MNKEFNLKVKLKIIINDIFKFPLYILTHPIKGYEEFKYEKKGKTYVAIFYLVLMVLAVTIAELKTGFLINPIKNQNFNILRTAMLVIVPVLLATVGNWSVTSLLDGKGKMIDIFKVITYSLAPYIWFIIPLTLVSNYLILNEISFYIAFVGIGVFMTVYMLFMGLLVIHEYGLAKTVLTVIFTIVAIAVILFIGILFFTLIQQFTSFIESVYKEFILRIS